MHYELTLLISQWLCKAQTTILEQLSGCMLSQSISVREPRNDLSLQERPEWVPWERIAQNPQNDAGLLARHSELKIVGSGPVT